MTTHADKTEADKLRQAGHTVLTSGWPDLLVIAPNGRPYGVELKRRGDVWHDQQPEMARVFADVLGIPYLLARSAEGLLMLDLDAIPGDYRPMEWEGRFGPIESDPRLTKV